MARVLAFCLDYNSSVTNGHSGILGSNESAPSTEKPLENMILLEEVPRVYSDGHSTADPENLHAEIEKPQFLPPCAPSSPQPLKQQVDSFAADKMTVTLPHHASPAQKSAARSKVLLVEDNVIKMKVFSPTLMQRNRIPKLFFLRFSCNTCKKQHTTT